eukprot:208170-Chlamydomonas_euryale.AAC.9
MSTRYGRWDAGAGERGVLWGVRDVDSARQLQGCRRPRPFLWRWFRKCAGMPFAAVLFDICVGGSSAAALPPPGCGAWRFHDLHSRVPAAPTGGTEQCCVRFWIGHDHAVAGDAARKHLLHEVAHASGKTCMHACMHAWMDIACAFVHAWVRAWMHAFLHGPGLCTRCRVVGCMLVKFCDRKRRDGAAWAANAVSRSAVLCSRSVRGCISVIYSQRRRMGTGNAVDTAHCGCLPSRWGTARAASDLCAHVLRRSCAGQWPSQRPRHPAGDGDVRAGACAWGKLCKRAQRGMRPGDYVQSGQGLSRYGLDQKTFFRVAWGGAWSAG